MKVKELKELLQDMPEDADVFIYSDFFPTEKDKGKNSVLDTCDTTTYASNDKQEIRFRPEMKRFIPIRTQFTHDFCEEIHNVKQTLIADDSFTPCIILYPKE